MEGGEEAERLVLWLHRALPKTGKWHLLKSKVEEVCGRGFWERRRRKWQPHSSTLAWNIPWMEEPGRLESMGSLRAGHN